MRKAQTSLDQIQSYHAQNYPDGGSNKMMIVRCTASAYVLIGRYEEALKWLDEQSLWVAPKGIDRAELLATQAWCAAELGDHLRSIPLAKRGLQEARNPVMPRCTRLC